MITIGQGIFPDDYTYEDSAPSNVAIPQILGSFFRRSLTIVAAAALATLPLLAAYAIQAARTEAGVLSITVGGLLGSLWMADKSSGKVFTSTRLTHEMRKLKLRLDDESKGDIKGVRTGSGLFVVNHWLCENVANQRVLTPLFCPRGGRNGNAHWTHLDSELARPLLGLGRGLWE